MVLEEEAMQKSVLLAPVAQMQGMELVVAAQVAVELLIPVVVEVVAATLVVAAQVAVVS
jgi:hypothetical protein